MKLVKFIGAWVCLTACCVFLAFSVATNLVIPLAAVSVAFSLAPESV